MHVLFFSVFLCVTSGYSLQLQKISPVTANPKLCYFSGAGMYFWWQLGVAKYMKESCCSSIYTDIPFAGASAGSITASLLLSGANLDTAPDTAIEFANRNNLFVKKSGWGKVVKDWLNAVIPQDLDMVRMNNLQIALSPAVGPPKLVSQFEGRADLINAILASCHIPVFLDGRAFTTYKGKKYMDGAFWYFVTKNRYTGLPLPKKTNPKSIFWVDYTDDIEFVSSVSGSFLDLCSVEGMYEMVESGYNFMKREHSLGRFPLAKYEAPLYFTASFEPEVETVIEDQETAAENALDYYKVPLVDPEENSVLL